MLKDWKDGIHDSNREEWLIPDFPSFLFFGICHLYFDYHLYIS